LKIRLKDILKGLLLLIIIADINAAELKISEINSSELNSSELSLALYYDEVEEGVEAQHMRYLINDRFLRIDNGREQADFILFDIDKKIIYSVNHDDQTILKIDNIPWKMPEWKSPEFKFSVSDKLEIVQGAPEVHNKPVYNYQLSADNKVCTQVFLIKDTYAAQMNILYLYQQVLSGQQVATLKNTPVEFHTPCFLTDQVYHAGDYYHLGLPLQITYSRGYMKLLKDFREISVNKNLFVLPEKYKLYKAFSE